jgi:hypothetical protein
MVEMSSVVWSKTKFDPIPANPWFSKDPRFSKDPWFFRDPWFSEDPWIPEDPWTPSLGITLAVARNKI